jgi:hypothetical protein
MLQDFFVVEIFCLIFFLLSSSLPLFIRVHLVRWLHHTTIWRKQLSFPIGLQSLFHFTSLVSVVFFLSFLTVFVYACVWFEIKLYCWSMFIFLFTSLFLWWCLICYICKAVSFLFDFRGLFVISFKVFLFRYCLMSASDSVYHHYCLFYLFFYWIVIYFLPFSTIVLFSLKFYVYLLLWFWDSYELEQQL